MKLVPPVSPDDKAANRRYLQKLASKLGPESSPVHAGMTLTNLTASRLIASDASKGLVSSDLYSWVTQTANQVLIADDGDGKITFSTPQDIHTGASPTFAALTLSSTLTLANNQSVRWVDSGATARAQIWLDGSDVQHYTGIGAGSAEMRISARAGGSGGHLTLGIFAGANVLTINADTLSVDISSKLTAGSFGSPLDVTNAREYGVELHYSGNNYNATAIRARAHAVTANTSAQFQGGLFQAANNDGIDVGVLNGIVSEAIGKSGSTSATIGTMRGGLAGAEWGAKDTVTNLFGYHIRVHSLNAAGEGSFGTGYGLYIENEAVGGNGQALDAGIYFKGTNLSAGNKAFTYGIDFSGATYGIADIQLSDGSVINKGGKWGINQSNPVGILDIVGDAVYIINPDGNVVIRLRSTYDGANSIARLEVGRYVDGSDYDLWTFDNRGKYDAPNDRFSVFHISEAATLEAFTILPDSGNVGINETNPQDKLEVNGVILAKDKICFTQDDRNEYIDSIADGYVDYGATTGHRFNTTVNINGAGSGVDSIALKLNARDIYNDRAWKFTTGKNAHATYGNYPLIIQPYSFANSGNLVFDIQAANILLQPVAGNVAIGCVLARTRLTVEGTLTLKEQASADADTAAYAQIWAKNDAPNTLWFVNDVGTEVRIAPQDLQTTASPTFASLKLGTTNLKTGALFELAKDAANAEMVVSCYHDTEATAALLTLRKADGSEASPALVDTGAVLGRIDFDGYDGSGWHTGAKIEARIAGGVSDGNNFPSELTFWTTPAGAGTPLQRMTIIANGYMGFGTIGPAVPYDFVHAATTPAGIMYFRGYQNNSPGHFIQFLGGVAGADIRGYLGYGKTGTGNASLWVNEVADYMQLKAMVGLHLGTAHDAHIQPEMTIVADKVGIGTVSPEYQLELSRESVGAYLALSCYHDTEATSPTIVLRKADNTEAAPALVDDTAMLGTIRFKGYDGSGWHTGAEITARIDGTPSDGTDMPTRVSIWTCPEGSATPVENLVVLPDGKVGVGKDPTSKFEVNGAISSATLTFSTAGPTDNVDVSGINTLFIDNSGNAVTIGGFSGGVDGQILCIALINAGANNVTLEHDEAGATQKIFLHAGSDETLNTEYGGWILVCHGGTDWHDCSHSKHV